MTADENKRIIIDTWKAFGTRDSEQIRQYFREDAVWIAQHRNATALVANESGNLTGATGLKGAGRIADFIANEVPRIFPHDRTIDFRGVYAAGNVVIVEERMRATLFNGRRYDNDYCFIFELEGGLIAIMREYMDTAKGFRMIFGEEAGARIDALGDPEAA